MLRAGKFRVSQGASQKHGRTEAVKSLTERSAQVAEVEEGEGGRGNGEGGRGGGCKLYRARADLRHDCFMFAPKQFGIFNNAIKF